MWFLNLKSLGQCFTPKIVLKNWINMIFLDLFSHGLGVSWEIRKKKRHFPGRKNINSESPLGSGLDKGLAFSSTLRKIEYLNSQVTRSPSGWEMSSRQKQSTGGLRQVVWMFWRKSGWEEIQEGQSEVTSKWTFQFRALGISVKTSPASCTAAGEEKLAKIRTLSGKASPRA